MFVGGATLLTVHGHIPLVLTYTSTYLIVSCADLYLPAESSGDDINTKGVTKVT